MRKALLAAAAIAALASANAMAQNTVTESPPTEQPPETRTRWAANPTPTAPAMKSQTTTQAVPNQGPNFIQVQNTDMLSSNVVGLDIYNSQNNDIGKIQDIAFDCIEAGDRVHSVRRRLPRHGHALCRGQSGRRHGGL